MVRIRAIIGADSWFCGAQDQENAPTSPDPFPRMRMRGAGVWKRDLSTTLVHVQALELEARQSRP